jgi:hypothetical protein
MSELTLTSDALQDINSIRSNDLREEVNRRLYEDFGPDSTIGKGDVRRTIQNIEAEKERYPIGDRPKPDPPAIDWASNQT